MNESENNPRQAAQLRASERCCALFIARNTTGLTVAEIASGIGISQRTFYRYFPIKAESVGPFFDWTIQRFNEVLVQAPAEVAMSEVLPLAFRASLLEDSAERTRRLFPLVFRDPEMWSVFLRKVHDGELSAAPLLAPRLGMESDSIAARAAAAAVASSVRIALEDMVTRGGNPETAFSRIIAQFAAGALRRHPDRDPWTRSSSAIARSRSGVRDTSFTNGPQTGGPNIKEEPHHESCTTE